MSNNEKTVIVTHDGRFHGDEVFAVAAILEFVDKSATVVRLNHNNPQSITEYKRLPIGSRVFVDIGGEYEPYGRMYDHHQPSYSGSLASFGMVWEHEVAHRIAPEIATLIRDTLVNSVDSVDLSRPPFRIKDDISVISPSHVVSSLYYKEDVKGKSSDCTFMVAVEFARSLLHSIAARGSMPSEREIDVGHHLFVDAAASVFFGHSAIGRFQNAAELRESMFNMADCSGVAGMGQTEVEFFWDSVKFLENPVLPTFKEDAYKVFHFSHIIALLPPLMAFDLVRDLVKRTVAESLRKESAQNLIERCLQEYKEKGDKSGVLFLPRSIRWRNIIRRIDLDRDINFVLYKDSNGWVLHSTYFVYNKAAPLMPRDWWGLVGEGIQAKTGKSDATACHSRGWFLLSKSKETALEAADVATKQGELDARKNGARRANDRGSFSFGAACLFN